MAPDPLTLASECPHCGLKRREGWIRCPRCRTLLFEGEPGVQAAPPKVLGRPWQVWAIAGGAVVAFAFAGYSLLSPGAPVTQPAAAPAAAAREARAPRAAETRKVDETVRTARLATDELRGGNAAYLQGDLDQALARFEAAVEANPDDPDAQNNLAQVLVRMNRVEQALPHFDAALAADAGRWAFRFNRARAYAQLKRWTEAVADYRAAIALFPDDYATHYNLGLALMEVKRYADAITPLERAVALAPSEPSFLITLGTAYVGAEQPDRAKAAFRRFLEIAPDDPEAVRVKALLAAFDAAR